MLNIITFAFLPKIKFKIFWTIQISSNSCQNFSIKWLPRIVVVQFFHYRQCFQEIWMTLVSFKFCPIFIEIKNINFYPFWFEVERPPSYDASTLLCSIFAVWDSNIQKICILSLETFNINLGRYHLTYLFSYSFNNKPYQIKRAIFNKIV